MAGVKPIPDGYSSVTPYLIVKGGAKALDWYVKAFGATELFRMPEPSGRVGHAELQLGSARVMLADEHPEQGIVGPGNGVPAGVHLLLYVEDVDAVFARAVGLGGKVLRPLANQFYGDRTGTLEDPFGHQWTVATHVEDVSPEELERRAKSAQG